MRDIFPRWIEKKLKWRESKGKVKLLFGASNYITSSI
jgi:hypothetical protein